MTQMIVIANQEDVAVEEFEVILARGKSPVLFDSAFGSKAALGK